MADVSHAHLSFNEFGLPVANAYDDIYFSNENGLAESHYVFLQHNDLPARWQTHSQRRFVIAESGFGTGLNLLATWQLLLEQAPESVQLHFISFEKFPLQRDDLRRALAAFPNLAPLAEELIAAYPPAEPGCHRRHLANGRILLDVWVGDIQTSLNDWLPHAEATVDAWFLDGFAPDKNPDMWTQTLYDAMAHSARDNATFATFTAAGAVRRGLQAAGFQVTKAKGFGRKREMLRGIRPARTASARTEASERATEMITVVGGGIAAACLVWHLAQQGYTVELIADSLADGASGNSQGAVYPLLHAERSPLAAFFTQAFGYATQFYQHQAPQHWFPTGVVQLAFNASREERYRKIVATGANTPQYASETVQWQSADATQQLWSALPAHPSLYYPDGGWLRPAAVVEHLVGSTTALSRLAHGPLEQIEPSHEGWVLNFADGHQLRRQRVILACGAGLKHLLAPFAIQLQNVRGQVSLCPTTNTSAECPLVVCYKGYFTPADNGIHCVGATYARDSEELTFRAADDRENLANLCQDLAPAQWPADLRTTSARAAIRNTTKDHLPLAGAVAENLWVIGGLGSRGFTAAPLVAACLAAVISHQPLPLPAALWQRLQPARLKPAPASP